MTVESPDMYKTPHRSLEGSRILVVDDEATVRTILRQILENDGYTVTEVASCGEILHHLDKDTYDLMLLDILMPGMDSLDVLKSVRQKYTMSELPVIMVTVKEESADVVEAFTLGANDYIVKPVDFAVLRARIKTHLFHKRAEDELRKANEELEHRVAERTAELLAINKALVSEIAERKQQDEELRESEARFQQLAEAIDDVFVVSDVKSKSVLYASPAYEQIWGRPVQKLYEDAGQLDDGIHAEDRLRIREAWARMIDQGERCEEEFRVIRPDGSLRWVRSRWYPVRDERGQVFRVAEINQDITNFKRDQQALQEREAMLADAAKLSTLGYAMWSEEQHCYLSVSEEFARIYGYSAEEYMRRFNTHDKSLETIHPEDRAQFEVAYFNQTKTDDVRHYEFRAIRKDKQVRHIKEWARLVKDSAGKPLHTLVIAQDVTDFKQAGEKLRESEARFQQIANVSDDVFVISDMESWDVLYASPAFEQIWGRSVQDLYKDVGLWDEGIHPDDRPRIQEAWARMKEPGGRYEEEYRVIRPDGSMRWVRVQAYQVRDKSGQPYRVAEIVQDITARKQQQQLLRESEARFQQLANATDDVFVIFDTESGDVLYVSPAYERIWGQPVQNLIKNYRHWDEGIHPDDRLYFQEAWRQMLDHGDRYEEEYRVLRPDGSIRWVRDRGYPVRDENGRVYRVAAFVTDITARKQQEQELRESEARFQQLAGVIDDVFVISDTESWDVLYASPAYERIWRRPVQDLIEDYSNWDKGIHPDDRLHVHEAWVQMLDHGDRYEEEYRVLRPDGSIRWVRDRGYPVRDENGRVYRVAAFVTDITARKQQEQELRESEARFQQLAGVIDDVFAMSDVKSWKVLYASPAFEKIWGRSVQDLYEDVGQWSEGIHPDDRQRVEESWARTVGQGGDYYEEEFRVIRPDGSLRWVRDRAYPIRDDNGQVYRVAEIVHDITEYKQAEEALRESNQRYRLLVETLNDGLSVMDENGIITFINEKICEMLGYSMDELLGKPALELFDDDNRDILRVQREQRKQGKNAPYELTWTRKDGGKICTIISPSPQFDSKGRFKESIAVVTDITERKQAEEKVQHLANHDELTGLPTLRLGKDRLSVDIALARRNKSSTALLFLDLDGFKEVNDSLGHQAGDLVLIEVGERLTRSVRETDTVVRVGGDEFIIILTQIKKKEFIIMIVKKIIKTLNNPIMIDGHNVNISASIGIAIYPDHGETVDVLIKQADEAMYVVKHKGKNNYAIA